MDDNILDYDTIVLEITARLDDVALSNLIDSSKSNNVSYLITKPKFIGIFVLTFGSNIEGIFIIFIYPFAIN